MTRDVLTSSGTLCTLLRYPSVFPASARETPRKGQIVSDWIDIHKDPQHIAREKQKARALRQSQWWRNKLAQGICAYCQGTFAPDELTMDHIVPLSRGGRSTKGNVVPCCAACNATKKYWTPAELLLQQLREQESKKT
jgi:5-methylcytosine-specific restriction protein A